MQMKNGCGHNDPALGTATIQCMLRKEGTQCKQLMEAAVEKSGKVGKKLGSCLCVRRQTSVI